MIRALSSSEILFYGGMVGMAVTIFMLVVMLVVFRITGNRLKRKLEQEYGKKVINTSRDI